MIVTRALYISRAEERSILVKNDPGVYNYLYNCPVANESLVIKAGDPVFSTFDSDFNTFFGVESVLNSVIYKLGRDEPYDKVKGLVFRGIAVNDLKYNGDGVDYVTVQTTGIAHTFNTGDEIIKENDLLVTRLPSSDKRKQTSTMDYNRKVLEFVVFNPDQHLNHNVVGIALNESKPSQYLKVRLVPGDCWLEGINSELDKAKLKHEMLTYSEKQKGNGNEHCSTHVTYDNYVASLLKQFKASKGNDPNMLPSGHGSTETPEEEADRKAKEEEALRKASEADRKAKEEEALRKASEADRKASETVQDEDDRNLQRAIEESLRSYQRDRDYYIELKATIDESIKEFNNQVTQDLEMERALEESRKERKVLALEIYTRQTKVALDNLGKAEDRFRELVRVFHDLSNNMDGALERVLSLGNQRKEMIQKKQPIDRVQAEFESAQKQVDRLNKKLKDCVADMNQINEFKKNARELYVKARTAESKAFNDSIKASGEEEKVERTQVDLTELQNKEKEALGIFAKANEELNRAPANEREAAQKRFDKARAELLHAKDKVIEAEKEVKQKRSDFETSLKELQDKLEQMFTYYGDMKKKAEQQFLESIDGLSNLIREISKDFESLSSSDGKLFTELHLSSLIKAIERSHGYLLAIRKNVQENLQSEGKGVDNEMVTKLQQSMNFIGESIKAVEFQERQIKSLIEVQPEEVKRNFVKRVKETQVAEQQFYEDLKHVFNSPTPKTNVVNNEDVEVVQVSPTQDRVADDESVEEHDSSRIGVHVAGSKGGTSEIIAKTVTNLQDSKQEDTSSGFNLRGYKVVSTNMTEEVMSSGGDSVDLSEEKYEHSIVTADGSPLATEQVEVESGELSMDFGEREDESDIDQDQLKFSSLYGDINRKYTKDVKTSSIVEFVVKLTSAYFGNDQGLMQSETYEKVKYVNSFYETYSDVMTVTSAGYGKVFIEKLLDRLLPSHIRSIKAKADDLKLYESKGSFIRSSKAIKVQIQCILLFQFMLNIIKDAKIKGDLFIVQYTFVTSYRLLSALESDMTTHASTNRSQNVITLLVRFMNETVLVWQGINSYVIDQGNMSPFNASIVGIVYTKFRKIHDRVDGYIKGYGS